jgi:hypothetical protein
MVDQQILGWLWGDTPNVQGQEFPLRQREVIIGRGTRSDVQLADPKISRKHARLRFGEDTILLEDLGSAHGTLVNGEHGEFFVLKDGDVIAMGDTLLVFKASPDTMATLMESDISTPAYLPAAPTPAPIADPLQSPTPQASGSKKRSGKMMFFLGMIPVLLIGIALIALFIILGGEPEPYEPAFYPDEQAEILPTAPQATATENEPDQPEEKVVTEQAVIEAPVNTPPGISIRPADPNSDGNLPVLSEIATYDESESSLELSVFTGEIPAGQDVILRYFHCASDEETLKDNLAVTTVDFVVDDFTVSLEELTLSEWDRGDKYCYIYDGVISGLPVGVNEILNRFEQTEEVFDGFETYPPGTFNTLYQIEVVDAAEASGDIEEGPRITLHVGDARFFSVRPEAVAYANTQYTDPPAEIMVMDNCDNSDCWRYNEWVAMGEPGQYIEVESTVRTTAIGVQLWGDDNDGWARVLVDGEEIWVGEMRGEDNQWPGGAFVRYLEVAGLEPGFHTLRFEPTGQGGSVTVYFFGIGAVIP